MTEMRRSMAVPRSGQGRYKLEPNRGYVGDPVAIVGPGVMDPTDVLFGQTRAEIINVEPGRILCAAPPNPPGTVEVALMMVDGEKVIVGNFVYEE